MLTDVRLVDGTTTMILWPPAAAAGVMLSDLDMGYPGTRESIQERPDDDGTNDDTTYTSASVVTLKFQLLAPNRSALDLLRWFARPSARPYLYITDDEWTYQRRALLRGDQLGAPITAADGPLRRSAQVSWRNPYGVWESATEIESDITLYVVTATGLRVTATPGLSVTATVGISVPAGASGGSLIVLNPGTIDAHWKARLYGPCVGPIFMEELTGNQIQFTSLLSVNAGEYLEINSRDRTAYLNGNTAATRLNYLNFAASTWWRLAANNVTNSVRYAAASGTGATTAAQMFWRPTWI